MNDSMTDKFIMVAYCTSSIFRSSVVLSQFDIQYWINNLHAQHPVSTTDFWLWKLLLISRFTAKRRMGKHRNIPPGHHLLLIVVNSLPQIIDKTPTNRHYQLGHCVHREQCMTELMSYIKHTYHIAGKFGRELNLAVWRISHPPAKLKSTNIKSLLLFCAHEGDHALRSKLVGVVFILTWYLVSLARITSTAYRSFKACFRFLFQFRIISHRWLESNTMMPPYAALHTICLASHFPQRSQVRMHMWQIRGMARSSSPIFCYRWLRPIHLI